MTNRGTFDRWTIESAFYDDSPTKVPLGPYERDWLPDRFTATAVDERAGWRVELMGTFDGAKIAVPTLSLSRSLGIKPGDLTALALPEIVRFAAESLGTVDEASHVARRPDRKPQGEELKLVAAVYCWNYATWGQPRQAVMRHWDLKPATANYWITQAAKVHSIPGRDEKD